MSEASLQGLAIIPFTVRERAVVDIDVLEFPASVDASRHESVEGFVSQGLRQ